MLTAITATFASLLLLAGAVVCVVALRDFGIEHERRTFSYDIDLALLVGGIAVVVGVFVLTALAIAAV